MWGFGCYSLVSGQHHGRRGDRSHGRCCWSGGYDVGRENGISNSGGGGYSPPSVYTVFTVHYLHCTEGGAMSKRRDKHIDHLLKRRVGDFKYFRPMFFTA